MVNLVKRWRLDVFTGADGTPKKHERHFYPWYYQAVRAGLEIAQSANTDVFVLRYQNINFNGRPFYSVCKQIGK